MSSVVDLVLPVFVVVEFDPDGWFAPELAVLPVLPLPLLPLALLPSDDDPELSPLLLESLFGG